VNDDIDINDTSGYDDIDRDIDRIDARDERVATDDVEGVWVGGTCKYGVTDCHIDTCDECVVCDEPTCPNCGSRIRENRREIVRAEISGYSKCQNAWHDTAPTDAVREALDRLRVACGIDSGTPSAWAIENQKALATLTTALDRIPLLEAVCEAADPEPPMFTWATYWNRDFDPSTEPESDVHRAWRKRQYNLDRLAAYDRKERHE